MTAPTPNAELAYRVLDHIDAHPEEWDQTRWWKAAEMAPGVRCGTAGCFAGWAVSLSGGRMARHEVGDVRVESGLGKLNGDYVPVAAAALLGLPMQDPWSEDEAENLVLFHENNTREDLGRLVEEIFGPRPVSAPTPNAELAYEDGEHCHDGWDEDRYGYQMGGPTSCTDVDGGGDCVHCECCCSCLGCEYGDRNSPPMTEAQRTPIGTYEATDGELAREAVEADEEPGEPDFDDDVPPNAGSAS